MPIDNSIAQKRLDTIFAPNVSSVSTRGPRSYFVTSGPAGTVEVDCFRCQHRCGRIVFCCDPVTKQPKRADECGGICGNCKGNICPECVKDGRCLPLEKALEQMEEAGRRQREYGF